MIDFAREGDTIYVSEFSRLARSTKDLLNIIQDLREKGVQVISLKENFDTSTPAGELAMTGASYLGFAQWAIARAAGPMLKAMAIT